MEIGSPAPDFSMPTDDGGSISLADLRGQKVVLYFYPKDDTPGCTKEACAFRDSIDEFTEINARIIGVSPDGIDKHQKFKSIYELPFTLASDPDHQVAEAYGVWKEKSMYGRTYMGIERSTFLIDEEGRIAQAWRKVKVPKHADAVLKAAQG